MVRFCNGKRITAFEYPATNKKNSTGTLTYNLIKMFDNKKQQQAQIYFEMYK